MKPATKKLFSIAITILSIFTYFIIGGYLSHVIMIIHHMPYKDEMIFFGPLAFPILLILASSANMLVHNLGHYFAGKSFGSSLLTIQIGPLAWIYENGKMRFLWRKAACFTGVCSMIPPKNNLTRKQHFWFRIWGIIPNILLALLSVFLLIITPYNIESIRFYLAINFLLICCTYCLIYTLPYVYRNRPSDGKIVFGLIFNTAYVQQLLLLDHLNSYFSYGPRPKDCFNDCPISLDKIHPQFRYMFAFLKFQSALDAEDYVAAKEAIAMLEPEISNIPAHQTQGYYYELVYFYSAVETNKEKAQYYYEFIKNELETDSDINGRRVLASYEYYINHNRSKAIECIAKAIVVSHQFPMKGQLVLENDLILKLQKALTTNQI